MENKILDSSNAAIDVENLFGQGLPGSTFHGLPLGTADGTPSGEIVLKVQAIPGSGGGSTQRTPSLSVITISGTVAAGTKEVEFIFDPSFVGTILGAAFSGASDASVRFVTEGSDTLAAISYTVSNGSFRLKKII